MGDLSVEPSMEDILSSIKRIIAEEGEPTPARQRRPQRVAAPAALRVEDDDDAEADHHEVLELNDPMPQPAPSAPTPRRDPVAAAVQVPPIQPVPAAPAEPGADVPTETIVSRQTASATRGSLDSLSRLMVKPEPASDGTLEGLVRDMLRPILREWLDAHLPEMVEAMVAREIAKITGQ
jgi:hypothetical protein